MFLEGDDAMVLASYNVIKKTYIAEILVPTIPTTTNTTWNIER